ncbi:GIY-YIG nuclease family protein [Candidatus Enterococcus mangumiae]|uniref:Excision endonuclease subunit UvrC n=1 Tax=Candidatus Enterococcus mangumiae TaxID=2230878 RepID=A0ABZ2T344_9ENTE|nr:GIY-YIG nuclease family protein [Enterococcus sp. DIV1094]MBO0491421.1 GIY-YIG nuclease family protein [Enterococcus sp. DIV1094]
MQPKEKVKNLPLLPGVYLMKNSEGKIIYVGKAKNLKNRVSTYFYQNKQHSKKVLRLVRSIADFEVVVVDTELDALLLECQLIQHYRPIYNRQMNYFDNYNYLHIQPDGLSLTNVPTARTYGPFRLYKKMPSILRIIEENYQMPWLSEISHLALQAQLPELKDWTFEQKKKEIQGLLQGRNKKLISYLKKRQLHFIEQLNFEKAAILQRDIELVTYFTRRIQEQKKFLRTPKITLSMPLASDESKMKHFLICYGQVADTAITEPGQAPHFYYEKDNTLSLKRQLSQAEIDPVQILISYQRKLVKAEQQIKKESGIQPIG